MNKNDSLQVFLDNSSSGCCLVLFYTSPSDLKPEVSTFRKNPPESFISAGPSEGTLGRNVHNSARNVRRNYEKGVKVRQDGLIPTTNGFLSP